MYALEVGKKRSQQNNSNKWGADVDRLTTYDSRYHRKMLKTLKKNRRKYLSHFQNTARHQLRRTAVSWTVIEPPAKSSKVKLYERLSIDFWHFYEIGSIMFRKVRWRLRYLPHFFSRSKNWLFTYIYDVYIFISSLTCIYENWNLNVFNSFLYIKCDFC